MAAERDTAGPIGLFGGSFDPVHNGHLRVATEACEHLNLSEVRLLPLNTPGHRPQSQVPAADRAAMLRVAVSPPLAVDTCEIERGGVTYTVDTLAGFRQRFPHRSVCLIMGLDAFLSLPTWHRPDQVLKLAHIIVAARPDIAAASPPGLDELIGNAHSARVADFHDTLAGHVYFLDSPLMPIASSDLRQRLREGRSIRYLVPAAVDDYIHQQRLYLA